jgi:hypothetical protein
VLGKQPLLTFSFDRCERTVAGFPNAQGRDRDACCFRDCAYAVQGS